MPAKNALKLYAENTYYHLYNRGVNKCEIFSDASDYKKFLSYLKLYLLPINLQVESLKNRPPSHQLKNYADRLKLLAYCLMPNHFHLLVWQQDAEAINFFMRSFSVKYSMYFNRIHKRIGPLFQGVYKAVIVENEPQLVYLSKYIHRNPGDLPSGRVLEDYRYSSYPNYLGKFRQNWLKPDDIIDLFSKTNPLLNYKSFVEETDERDLVLIKNQVLEEV